MHKGLVMFWITRSPPPFTARPAPSYNSKRPLLRLFCFRADTLDSYALVADKGALILASRHFWRSPACLVFLASNVTFRINSFDLASLSPNFSVAASHRRHTSCRSFIIFCVSITQSFLVTGTVRSKAWTSCQADTRASSVTFSASAAWPHSNSCSIYSYKSTTSAPASLLALFGPLCTRRYSPWSHSNDHIFACDTPDRYKMGFADRLTDVESTPTTRACLLEGKTSSSRSNTWPALKSWNKKPSCSMIFVRTASKHRCTASAVRTVSLPKQSSNSGSPKYLCTSKIPPES